MRPALSTIAVTRFRPVPWTTDAFVLLRPLACDTRTKEDLSRLIGCGHELHPIPRPRLFGAAQFTFHHPRRPLPPLPAQRISSHMVTSGGLPNQGTKSSPGDYIFLLEPLPKPRLRTDLPGPLGRNPAPCFFKDDKRPMSRLC